MKPLVIFDIDGTITATIEADDYGFIKTFNDLYRIDLGGADWGEFKDITDLGITRQVFKTHFSRFPKRDEIDQIKKHFLGLLEKQFQLDPSKFSEVVGAGAFFNQLQEKEYRVAIATGGWQETAEFKLERVGLDVSSIPFANSNHHHSRADITKLAIEFARDFYAAEFERIIYFGDGRWDLMTCREMGIDFIGVDFYRTGVLRELGATQVIGDFTEIEKLFAML